MTPSSQELESPGIPGRFNGTVGGGFGNRTGEPADDPESYPFDTVGGGQGNLAFGGWSTVGGGSRNYTSSSYGTVAGGFLNVVTGYASAVAGGDANEATGNAAAVGGGTGNVASGTRSAVAGGIGNTAIGGYSVVPGGISNVALGDFSFAGGRRAKANSVGCFVWADSTDADFTCGTANAFIVRATGGVVIRSGLAPVTGVILGAGSSTWAMGSDRDTKENVAPVDPRAVLDRLIDVPIAIWNYAAQAPRIRHMGPMAQDLHAAFGLGESDRHIASIDADGIAMAAIQGLNAKLEATIVEQSREIAALRERLDALLARLSRPGGVER